MRKYRLSPLAEFDLDEIWNYIARDDADIAADFIRKLIERFVLISRQPEIGRVRDELAPGIRQVQYKDYAIFYTVSEMDVEIARVLHGARDIESQFEM